MFKKKKKGRRRDEPMYKKKTAQPSHKFSVTELCWAHTQSHGPFLSASSAAGMKTWPQVQPSYYLCGTDCDTYRASPARGTERPGSPAETASPSAPPPGTFHTGVPDPATHHDLLHRHVHPANTQV